MGVDVLPMFPVILPSPPTGAVQKVLVRPRLEEGGFLGGGVVFLDVGYLSATPPYRAPLFTKEGNF